MKARKGKSTRPPVDEDRAEETSEIGERKEKVLHARIPQSLDREIKRRAQHLGLSVSTVVRQVLLGTFDIVEDIVADGADLALSITGGESRRANRTAQQRLASEPAGISEADVIGWQEVILNRNALCHLCNGILAKGTRAATGIRETPGPAAILCVTCLDSMTKPPTDGRKRPPKKRSN